MSEPTAGFSFNLEFWEAIEQARTRGAVLPDEFYSAIPAAARRNAFTVSYLTSLGQIQTVLERLTKTLQEGKTLADFQEWARGQSFELTDRHLETVFRTGIQTAYNAGHWRHFEEGQDDRPFLLYDAINDSRTRPHHAACDGIIRPVGDPFWRTHSPPLGFNCRCSLVSLSAQQAQARSRGGKGLNKPDNADMHADGEGWGGKPTEWGDRLAKLAKQRLAKAAPAVAEAAKGLTPPRTLSASMRLDDALKLGRERFTELGEMLFSDAAVIAWRGRTFADLFAEFARTGDYQMAEMVQEGYIKAVLGEVAKTRSMGKTITAKPWTKSNQAKVRKTLDEASKCIPDDWITASELAGGLSAKFTTGRAFHWTAQQDCPRGADFGRHKIKRPVKRGEGFLLVPDSVGTAIHEFMHRVQRANPELDRLFQEYFARRTQNEALEPLRFVTGNEKYKVSEVTKKDRFIDPYQGRVYDGGSASEMITMAFQYLFDTGVEARAERFFFKLCRDDPEMLQLVLGTLFHHL